MDEYEEGLVQNIRDFVRDVSVLSRELYALDCTLNDETDPQSVAKLMEDIEAELNMRYTPSKVDLALNPLRYFIDQQRRVVASKQMLLDMLYKTVYPIQTRNMEEGDEFYAGTIVEPYRREQTPNSMRCFEFETVESGESFYNAMSSNERMQIIGGFDWVGMHHIDARFFTRNGFMKDAVVETESSNFVFMKRTWFDHDKIKSELLETNPITVATLADRIRTKLKLAEQTLAMDRVAGVHGGYLGQMMDPALNELEARTTVNFDDLIDVTSIDEKGNTYTLIDASAGTCVHFHNDVPDDAFTAIDDISTTDPSCVTRDNLYETHPEPRFSFKVWLATDHRSNTPTNESTMKIVAESVTPYHEPENANKFMDGYNMYLAPKYMETVTKFRQLVTDTVTNKLNGRPITTSKMQDVYHVVIVTRSTTWHGSRPMFIHDTLTWDQATNKYKRKNPDDAKGYTWDKFIRVMKTKPECKDINPRSMIGIFSSDYLHKSCLTSRELWAITHQPDASTKDYAIDKATPTRVLYGMTRGADNVWALAVVCDAMGAVVKSDYDIVSNSMTSPNTGFVLIYFHKKVGGTELYAVACASTNKLKNSKVVFNPTNDPKNKNQTHDPALDVGAYTLHTGWVPKDRMLNADYFNDAAKYLSGPKEVDDKTPGKIKYWHPFLPHATHAKIINTKPT